jgi:Domain of unknown function (DU1801)
MKKFSNPQVSEVFDTYPPEFRKKLLALRELIYKTAETMEGVGELEETLRWGEPTYITSQNKTGSIIRIAWKKKSPSQYAMYFHCQTDLIQTFRTLFPTEFRFEGNRSIIFEESDTVPVDSLTFCIAAALTYHRTKETAGGRKPGHES